jgi:uncharacterized membrane protein
VLLEEKRNFLGRNVRLVLVPLGLVLILVVPLAMLLLFYRRYGREPSMQYDVVYEHEPPRPAPPVVVGTMLHQKPDRSTVWSFTFRGVFASLLELCRQRVVSVQELKEGDRRRYQFTLERPDLVEKLEPFSRSAAVFLFHRVAGPGNVLTDRMLRDYARNNQAAFRCLLNELDARATGWWRRELGVDIIGPDSEQAYRRYMLITVLLLTAVVVPTGAGGSWVLGALAALAAGFGFAAGGRSILRWSEPAYLEHRRWKAFRRFLVEFSAIEQAPVSLLPIWEQYYVFAVALGVAKQFLANVTRLAAERGAAMVVPAWYAAAGSGQAGMAALSDSMAGFASFAGNFSGMVSSFSSSTTSGGGFSGGGGGGGGGGSSGAG